MWVLEENMCLFQLVLIIANIILIIYNWRGIWKLRNYPPGKYILFNYSQLLHKTITFSIEYNLYKYCEKLI